MGREVPSEMVRICDGPDALECRECTLPNPDGRRHAGRLRNEWQYVIHPVA